LGIAVRIGLLFFYSCLKKVRILLHYNLLYQTIKIWLMNYEQFKHKDKSIFLVDMTRELDYHFSQLVQSAIEKQLHQRKKI
jgi:hypothetical protein